MKQTTLFYSLLLALPLCAAELTVNKPLTETLTDAQVVTIKDASELKDGSLMVLTTTLTFTLPDTTPLYDDVKSEKLALAADTDGTILIADGTTQGWVKSDLKVTESDTVTLSAHGYLTDGTLTFDVTLNDATTPITVTAPNSGTTLTAVELTGEGSAAALTLALVDTAIIPGSETAKQDPALISAYITWLNDVAKGGAMASDATAAELSDAFAMNVGGIPSLKVTAVDPINGTITVIGSATSDDTTSAISLKEIHGKLYLSWAETLGGEATVIEADIVAEVDNALTLQLPEKARFVKASVSLSEPTDTTL